ncbi:hypothetical protein [Microbacterium sp. GCS4]|uniref:hypothetical protein n=1 Tax=Microbacterium sp. GCS4 TaxID=1692239 RepID=UPI000682837D|nr:hypothetical protein [Microbacterium sp. GCS4]KNY07914.1 hypothetical protein AKH00_06770 [Microbacterium sp. GCS4]
MSTIARHDYTAKVGATVLSLDEDNPGDVGFDSGRIPYVEGSVTLAVEDFALLDDLDPRDGRRVVVEAKGTWPDHTQARTFDLGIRDAIPNRDDSTVTLELASDEAILDDFAQLVDDPTPRTHQASLRAVCNYALGKIGATLQPGGPDADVTAYWEATNVLVDPACSSVANFTGGGNAHTIVRYGASDLPIPNTGYIYWTSGAAGQSFIQFNGGDPSTRVGDTWTLQAWMNRAASAGAVGRLRAYEINAAGSVLRTIESAPTNINSSGWTPLALTFTVQNPRTVKLMVYTSAIATAGGQTYALTAPMLHKAGEPIAPFTGSTGGPGYTYSWVGTANASASTRKPVIERVPESLVWSAGISGMAFLRPLLLASGLRLVCDEKRRWSTRDASYRIDGMQNYRDRVNIIRARERLSLDAAEWYDAAVYEYIWTDSDGVEQRRIDAFALTASPRKVLRVELRGTPFPGPGRAEHVVRRAQGRGRTVTVTANPTWTEQTDQALAILLEATPIQTGVAGTVTYDFGTNVVTVTSRTTDTPAGAIDLLTGTINALTGTINNL